MQQFQEMNEYGEISAATLFKTVQSNDEGSSAPPTPTPTTSTALGVWTLLAFISLFAWMGFIFFTDNAWAMGIFMVLTFVCALGAGACKEDDK